MTLAEDHGLAKEQSKIRSYFIPWLKLIAVVYVYNDAISSRSVWTTTSENQPHFRLTGESLKNLHDDLVSSVILVRSCRTYL